MVVDWMFVEDLYRKSDGYSFFAVALGDKEDC